MLKRVKKELKKIYRLMLNPSDNALFIYNIAKFFHNKKLKIFTDIFKLILIKNYGIHIGMNAKIGDKFNIPHPVGIIIGEGCIIGNNVTIYQNVTLGKKKENISIENNYPIIKDNVIIFSGAQIIGSIVIGKNAVIGANSVVLTNVENDSVYVGIPAKRIK